MQLAATLLGLVPVVGVVAVGAVGAVVAAAAVAAAVEVAGAAASVHSLHTRSRTWVDVQRIAWVAISTSVVGLPGSSNNNYSNGQIDKQTHTHLRSFCCGAIGSGW